MIYPMLSRGRRNTVVVFVPPAPHPPTQDSRLLFFGQCFITLYRLRLCYRRVNPIPTNEKIKKITPSELQFVVVGNQFESL